MDVQVSVLIPVYNTEQYLKECVDSVRNQTLNKIEILCLDDGSKDGSAYILEQFAQQDTRIRVIRKENSGYGNTINLGIRMAKGKYVAIVESDDYIESDMLADLYQLSENNGCDFVKSNYAFFWGDQSGRIYEEMQLIPQKELYGKCLSQNEIRWLFRGYIANCTGIYKKSFLLKNYIFHNETPGASYQDLGFFFQVMMRAQRGYLSDKSYYRYRQDNQASSIASREKVFCVCDEHQFIYQKMTADEKLFKQYLPIYQMFRFQSCLFNVKRIAQVYRLDFLERVRADYAESKCRGELDLSDFYEEERKALFSIMESPSNYLEDMFRVPYRLREAVRGYSNLIIYGAGACGNEVYGWLRDDIKSFHYVVYAITDQVAGKKYKNGLEVKCICDLMEYVKSAAVIVAVTNRYKNDIVENLKRLGFDKIITLE